MKADFVHRTARDFLVDTENGRKILQGCSKSDVQLAWIKGALLTARLLGFVWPEYQCRQNLLKSTLEAWADDEVDHSSISELLLLADKWYSDGCLRLPLTGHASWSKRFCAPLSMPSLESSGAVRDSAMPTPYLRIKPCLRPSESGTSLLDTSSTIRLTPKGSN